MNAVANTITGLQVGPVIGREAFLLKPGPYGFRLVTDAQDEPVKLDVGYQGARYQLLPGLIGAAQAEAWADERDAYFSSRTWVCGEDDAFGDLTDYLRDHADAQREALVDQVAPRVQRLVNGTWEVVKGDYRGGDLALRLIHSEARSYYGAENVRVVNA